MKRKVAESTMFQIETAIYHPTVKVVEKRIALLKAAGSNTKQWEVPGESSTMGA